MWHKNQKSIEYQMLSITLSHMKDKPLAASLPLSLIDLGLQM